MAPDDTEDTLSRETPEPTTLAREGLTDCLPPLPVERRPLPKVPRALLRPAKPLPPPVKLNLLRRESAAAAAAARPPIRPLTLPLDDAPSLAPPMLPASLRATDVRLAATLPAAARALDMRAAPAAARPLREAAEAASPPPPRVLTLPPEAVVVAAPVPTPRAPLLLVLS